MENVKLSVEQFLKNIKFNGKEGYVDRIKEIVVAISYCNAIGIIQNQFFPSKYQNKDKMGAENE